jgi:hypothetical protein
MVYIVDLTRKYEAISAPISPDQDLTMIRERDELRHIQVALWQEESGQIA